MVAYSKTILKSSSFITPLISGYICSTTDWTLANLNITNMSRLRLSTGGIALIYCVVNSKLHCKCRCFIHRLLMAEWLFLNAWGSPTRSSKQLKLILGYLYDGCGMSWGSLKSYFDNIISSSGSNRFRARRTLQLWLGQVDQRGPSPAEWARRIPSWSHQSSANTVLLKDWKVCLMRPQANSAPYPKTIS